MNNLWLFQGYIMKVSERYPNFSIEVLRILSQAVYKLRITCVQLPSRTPTFWMEFKFYCLSLFQMSDWLIDWLTD